jgi:hypothetical protein
VLLSQSSKDMRLGAHPCALRGAGIDLACAPNPKFPHDRELLVQKGH